MKSIEACLILIAPLVMISACGGGSSSPSEPEAFTITSIVSPGGSITPSSADLPVGESITFTLNNDLGFTLDSVTGCDGVLDGMEYTVQQLSNHCSITVNFSQETYIVDSTVSIGGSIDKPTSEVAHGDSLDLMLIPHTDHQLENVVGCDGQLSELSYSTGPVFSDCTVDVEFSSLLPETNPPLTRIRIPLVFHILDGGFTDVSDEEIISQIEATNKHFRQQNIDELDSLIDTHKPFVADVGIQFYLADRSPGGEPHSGIVRVDTDTPAFGNLYSYNYAQPEFGGSAAWPTDRYINIWVGDNLDRHGNLRSVGIAYPPTLFPAEYIGVSIEESVVGVIDPQHSKHAQGKTLTHELGHFFGLIGHTHGDINEENTHAHLPCDNDESTTCKNSDLNNNFMNVNADDPDMKMFSLSQQRVMRDWLETGPLTMLYQNNLTNN